MIQIQDRLENHKALPRWILWLGVAWIIGLGALVAFLVNVTHQ